MSQTYSQARTVRKRRGRDRVEDHLHSLHKLSTMLTPPTQQTLAVADFRAHVRCTDKPPFIIDRQSVSITDSHFQGIDIDTAFGLRPTRFLENLP